MQISKEANPNSFVSNVTISLSSFDRCQKTNAGQEAKICLTMC